MYRTLCIKHAVSYHNYVLLMILCGAGDFIKRLTTDDIILTWFLHTLCLNFSCDMQNIRIPYHCKLTDIKPSVMCH